MGPENVGRYGQVDVSIGMTESRILPIYHINLLGPSYTTSKPIITIQKVSKALKTFFSNVKVNM
jgi:hypothetical protein